MSNSLFLLNLLYVYRRCEKLDHAAYFVVAKDIAQGMNYLHRHDPQVLHLDLKSMNVLLDSYTRAKIADFGFSILRRSRSASPTQQRGSIRGTPAWMAPELLCKGEVSAKCDVYSYAIILWEMLTSSHPFKGLDIFQIMERTEAGGRPTLPVSRMSRELKELITSCWAQNPSLRPSFEEILGALESAAVPSSWRGLLQKANVKSSLLSDVAAARTIISVVEQSVELVRRSLQQQRASKNKDKKSRSSGDNETDQHIYETIDTLGVTDPEILQRYQRGPSSRNASGQDYPNHASPFQRSSPSRQPYPRDASRKGQNKKDRTREFSPQKEGRRSISKTSRPQSDMKRRSGSRDIRERKIEEGNRDRSRQKRKDKHSEDIVRRRADRASPEKMDRVNDRKRNSREKREQGRKPDNSKSRSKKSREYEHYEHQKNRDHKNPSSRGKKEPKQVYDRRNESSKQRYSKKKRSRSLESVVRYTDFRTDVRGLDRHYRGGHERLSDISREKNHRKNYVRERTSSEEERGHGSKQRPNKHRLADSRDSLGESQNESWTSIECSSYEGSNNSVEFDDYGIGKEPLRYSPSPRRRSPTRHFSPTRRNQGSHAPDRQQNAAYNYSLERRRSPRSPQRKRAASGSRFGPLVVTSEQLMTQKQRLRPVRPSELSDLSQMPETSLNDISLILKTAITKRRNAFDEGLSGRDSFRSDIEWSDWH
ncbi:hypothetical protein SK128_014400 [Halocaridina rubra]|uniref:Protein kinase domain-containing protein n=1 Tax=Halocaridina rubra TaxID=373956 RepID=A0AAN8XKS8_HALRR